MNPVIRVEGLAELTAKLHRIPEAVTNKIMRGAVLAGAREIAKAARRNAAGLTRTPKRQRKNHPAPGTLAKSIIAVRDRKLSGPYTPTAMVWVASGKKYRKKGRDAYYWPWVEMGHKIVPRGAKKASGMKARIGIAMRRRAWDGKTVRPYPILGPAFRSAADAALAKVVEFCRGRIDQVMKSA